MKKILILLFIAISLSQNSFTMKKKKTIQQKEKKASSLVALIMKAKNIEEIEDTKELKRMKIEAERILEIKIKSHVKSLIMLLNHPQNVLFIELINSESLKDFKESKLFQKKEGLNLLPKTEKYFEICKKKGIKPIRDEHMPKDAIKITHENLKLAEAILHRIERVLTKRQKKEETRETTDT